jgi:flagellar motor switch/type III secretory pathway protein FliN
MAVKDICRQFRAGNVVRLDKQKGEPLEVFVNGLLFARAEVVFEGDQIGARIIEVVDADGASRTANSLHFLR